MNIFSPEELRIILERNDDYLGEDGPLSDEEIADLKLGHNVSLATVLHAKAIIASHYEGRLKSGGYITRSELGVLVEEHNNLAAKMLLIFEALANKGIISERDLFDASVRLRGELGEAAPAKTKSKKSNSARKKMKV